ncbi:MAG: metallophosphoesterase, partial [Lachnospiraceae bacterium]|nr:metallophosphoesterase [Lachnospiraceae bacterium]
IMTGYRGSDRLTIDYCEICTDSLSKESPPLRIALLADLHDRLWGVEQCDLLEVIDHLECDLVLCAGDMLLGEKAAQTEHALCLFRELARRKTPVICANGNHESRMRLWKDVYGDQYEQYTKKLQELGVCVLVDETREISWGGNRILIHGYELPLDYYRKFGQPHYGPEELTRVFGPAQKDACHILLAHNPVFFEAYASWGADLTLSGHLHGGIIRLPRLGGFISPQARLFPKYSRGLYSLNGKYMVVSAGLGEHTVPIRINNPHQLFSITVRGMA